MWYAHVTNHKFHETELFSFLISKIERIPHKSLKLLTTNTKKVTPFIIGRQFENLCMKEQVFCGFGC